MICGAWAWAGVSVRGMSVRCASVRAVSVRGMSARVVSATATEATEEEGGAGSRKKKTKPHTEMWEKNTQEKNYPRL